MYLAPHAIPSRPCRGYSYQYTTPESRVSRLDAVADSCHNDDMKTPDYSLALLVGHRVTATQIRRLLSAARDFLGAQPDDAYAKAGNDLDFGLRNIAGENDVTAEDLFRPLRVALAGQLASPGLFEMIRFLGKQETLARVDRALLALGDRAAD
jgi:glutamyl/glutaminyl-tRNA synthetase